MMIYKAIIIEDEALFAEVLQHHITDLYKNQIEIISIATDIDCAYEQIMTLHPHILFLDVQLGASTAFDLLAKFQHRNFEIIFTTSHDQYSLKAIKLDATDYILKPYVRTDIINAIEKVLKKLQLQNNAIKQINKISLSTLEGVYFIETNDIIRCESYSNYTTFYLRNHKPITISKTLKDVSNLLNDTLFCRVHRTHIVNVNHIIRYNKSDGGSVVLIDGTEISISKSYKEHVLHKMKIKP